MSKQKKYYEDWYKRTKSMPEYQKRRASAQLLKKYGITFAQKAEMFEAQDGKCLACSCEMTIELGKHGCSTGTAVVDHDHETGRIRGLLCNRCNMALGMLDDDVKKIEALATYLKVHGRITDGWS